MTTRKRTSRKPSKRRSRRGNVIGQGFPKSARDWQLYSNMKGTAQAAKELSAALKLAETRAREELQNAGKSRVPGILYKVYSQTVEPVMDRYAKFGATDTEPRAVAKTHLNKIANDEGFYGYIDF